MRVLQILLLPYVLTERAATHVICLALCLQELILFLQRLPTAEWGEKEVESVLSRAYMWRASFDHARSHLSQ